MEESNTISPGFLIRVVRARERIHTTSLYTTMEALIASYRETSSDSESDSHPPIAAFDDNRSPPTYSTLPIRPGCVQFPSG
ncbi:hypothetical protein L1887_07449 [Cichorium endivia]|nr:hypothetical protein L1887_07449 [Cichorium endivia]